MPVFTDGELLSLTVNESASYDGSALWGYMNGGADLYLEYGFEYLTVQTIQYRGSEYQVEFYKMSTPEGAFGIYSVSTFGGENQSCAGRFNLLWKTQFQLAIGNYYVTIAALSGKKTEYEELKELGCAAASKIQDGQEHGIEPDLPSYFFRNPLLSDFLPDLDLIKGRLGLENSFASPVNTFIGFGDCTASLLPIETDGKSILFCFVTFAARESMLAYIDSNPWIQKRDDEGLVRNDALFLFFRKADDKSFWLIESDIDDREKFLQFISPDLLAQ
jgi:hypothetical protein